MAENTPKTDLELAPTTDSEVSSANPQPEINLGSSNMNPTPSSSMGSGSGPSSSIDPRAFDIMDPRPSSMGPGQPSNMDPEPSSSMGPEWFSSIDPGPFSTDPGTFNITDALLSSMFSGESSNMDPEPSSMGLGQFSCMGPGQSTSMGPGPSSMDPGPSSMDSEPSILRHGPSYMGSEQSSSMVPGQSSSMVPGQSSSMVPGQSSSMVPGQSSSMVPGQSSSMCPEPNSSMGSERSSASNPGLVARHRRPRETVRVLLSEARRQQNPKPPPVSSCRQEIPNPPWVPLLCQQTPNPPSVPPLSQQNPNPSFDNLLRQQHDQLFANLVLHRFSPSFDDLLRQYFNPTVINYLRQRSLTRLVISSWNSRVFSEDLVQFVMSYNSPRNEFRVDPNYAHDSETTHFDNTARRTVRRYLDQRLCSIILAFSQCFPSFTSRNSPITALEFRHLTEGLRDARWFELIEGPVRDLHLLLDFICFVAQFCAFAYEEGLHFAPYRAMNIIIRSIRNYIRTWCNSDEEHFWRFIQPAWERLLSQLDNRRLIHLMNTVLTARSLGVYLVPRYRDPRSGSE